MLVLIEYGTLEYESLTWFSVKSGQKKKEGKKGLTSEDILYIRFAIYNINY